MNKKVIRLKRRKNAYHTIFDIILIFQKQPLFSGAIIEKLGYIRRSFNKFFFCINLARVGFWLNKGAILKFSVRKYIAKMAV